MKDILGDCATLASGTIATLTGYNEYDIIDEIQTDLVFFVQANAHKHNWETWMDAWDSFIAEHPEIKKLA